MSAILFDSTVAPLKQKRSLTFQERRYRESDLLSNQAKCRLRILDCGSMSRSLTLKAQLPPPGFEIDRQSSAEKLCSKNLELSRMPWLAPSLPIPAPRFSEYDEPEARQAGEIVPDVDTLVAKLKEKGVV